MKKIGFCALLIGSAVVLSACTSSPVPTDQAKPVPSARVFAPASMLQPCHHCGILIIKRDTIVGVTPMAHVFIETQHVADIDNGEKITLHLPPSDYVVEVKQGGPLNNPSAMITIRAGQTKIYRISFSVNSFHLQPTAK